MLATTAPLDLRQSTKAVCALLASFVRRALIAQVAPPVGTALQAQSRRMGAAPVRRATIVPPGASAWRASARTARAATPPIKFHAHRAMRARAAVWYGSRAVWGRMQPAENRHAHSARADSLLLALVRVALGF